MKYSNILPVLVGSSLLLFIALLMITLAQYPHQSERVGRGLIPITVEE